MGDWVIMSKKIFLAHAGTPQMVDFDPHGSGRYRQGSGENPHQHGFDFLLEVKKMRAQGMSETEIAKALGYSTGELRAKVTNYGAEKRAYEAGKVYKMKYERQMSNTAIAKELGISEGKVRNLLKNPENKKDEQLRNTVDILKKSLEEKKYIDVGEGVERSLGIPRTKLNAALQQLKEEGYYVDSIQVPQINSATGQKTTVLVLGPEGTTGRELHLNMDEIRMIKEYHSDDLGTSYGFIERPAPVDSKRIEISYADKDGYQPKDGIIELRPGVEDLSLGQSTYAQVRINVDDKYYLKGMAVYSDDLPKGVDIRFNTNKMEGTPPEKVFKEMKTLDGEKGSEIDWDNPFGATIKAGGQDHYIGADGKQHLSAINKVNEEGDWGAWDKTLAAQFLTKQDKSLAKKQLNITYLNKREEFEDLKAVTNPTIREKLLLSFADDCEASAVELKAAALPRQATQVLFPLGSIKETEVYAPNFKDGEYVCLVRYPHSGPSEIPNLRVNNKNPEAVKIFGKSPKDCVVINPKVAQQLSGADFDGDSVVVIPNKNGKTINVAPQLKGLKDFDPHIQYAGYEGMRVMKESRKGAEMGTIANLITDMTLIGCTDEELTRAIKHSMVVIDAPKHKLDYKRSEKENRIKELKDKYQGGGGAATLISRAKSPQWVDERRLYVKIDPNTGEKIYDTYVKRDPETGEKVYNPKYKNKSWIKTTILKDGTVKQEVKYKQQKVKSMAEVDDAFQLASDPNNPYPMERIYGVYANQMKDMAKEARLAAINTKHEKASKSAAKAYAPEVESLERKLNIALSNAPYERRAQMAANVILKQKQVANPNMTDSEKKKKGQQALNSTRARYIPNGKKQRVVITEKELEAINANALGSTKLKSILNNTDMDTLQDLVMPKKTKGLTKSQIASAKAKLNSGYYTQGDVAEELGISTTTLMRYLNK